MNTVKVKVSSLPHSAQKEIREGQRTISKFKRVNKLDFDLVICIDYSIESPGIFYDENPNRIYVNPSRCQRLKSKNRRRFARGYINSYSIQDVIVHEFGHFLDVKYGLLFQYLKRFGKTRCKVNDNCNSSVMEEIAELLNIYIINPMLLKLIDKDRWSFFRSIFKSPNPTSKPCFVNFWMKWPKEVQRNCAFLWQISVQRGRLHHASGCL